MKWLTALLLGASALCGATAQNGYTVPPGSSGYYHGNSTQAIQFDAQSLYIDGERVFVYGGEFHPWRLPVPELWTDILQKFKAAGFNTVSIYTHWGTVEHKRGSVQWTYFRDVELFYQIAQRVGVYVISRPGPYINAETTGGGFPGWLTNIADVGRTADPGYIAAFQNYVKTFSAITHKYQYPDGPVIAVQAENEFYDDASFNTTASAQMAQLVADLRAGGIDRVPITHNDVYPSGHFATGLGQVDWYGFDGYPNGFDCVNPGKWNELPNYFKSGHDAVAPWTPLYVAEFQAGAFDNWGGNGYDKCYQLTGPEFVNVFWKNLVADGSKSFSGYMLYGGTNWGNLANPGQYSSYDYGAAIRESRIITPKYNEMKLQGLFYQASPSLYGTDVLSAGVGAPFADTSSVFTTHLGTSANGTNYYVVRQIANTVITPTSFKLNVNTSTGALTIPQYGSQITLAGRETKIIVTEYPFGKNVLKYSTAEILTQATIDGTDYLVLYVPIGQSVEAVVSKGSTPTVTGSSSISAKLVNGSVIITGTASGANFVKFGSTTVLVLDKVTATAFWQPRLGKTANASPKTPSVIVGGPHLVRNATLSGSTLALVGDTNTTTPLTVIAPSSVTGVTWNGKSVSVKKGSAGELTGSVAGPQALSDLPKLTSRSWKTADSLPEVDPKFDDSEFVAATKTSVGRKQKPYTGKYALYADEYGFHQGSFIFRGYFNGTATGVSIAVQGGNYFGFLAYINGQFLGSGQGLNGADQVNATLTFPTGSITPGNNVLTIVMDSQGLNDDWVSDDSFKAPRGIRGYTLLGGGDFSVWKVTGNLGGEDFPDKVRGGLNEGGIWADRVGAILPGYPDSSWKASSPFVGISKPGIQAYRTKFNLGIPAGTDVPLALKFKQTSGSNYRAIIYVNGWQFGKFINNVGPQTVYPIPEGILNHRGVNELVITLWAFDNTGAKIADLELVSLANLASGKEAVAGNTVRSPTFQELR